MTCGSILNNKREADILTGIRYTVWILLHSQRHISRRTDVETRSRTMRISRFSNFFEGMKFFRKPLQKARDRFYSQIQLYDPNEDFGINSSHRNGSDILKEGRIRVQSRGFRRKTDPRSWKQMYAILEESKLFLYDRESDEMPKFSISLDETVGIFREDTEYRGVCHCIRLASTLLNCSLCAEDENERDSWLTMMLTVISERLLSRSESRQKIRYSMYY